MMTWMKRKYPWCQTSYYIIVFVFSGVFLFVPYQAQGAADPLHLSSKACSAADDSCGPYTHRLTCGPAERLAVLEAAHGFKPQEVFNQCHNATTAGGAGGTCPPDHCCRYNSSRDCTQPFSEAELDRVRTQCSYTNSCQVQTPRANNSDCSAADSMALTSSYSLLTARCIPGTDETTSTQSAINNNDKNTTANNNNNNNNKTSTSNTTSASTGSNGSNRPTIQDVTDGQFKASSSEGTTTDTSEDDGGLDTTDIIVYTAIGLSALLFFSFTYVCVRKISRKGCPKWCPPYCRHLECGNGDKTTNDSNNPHDPTTQQTTAPRGNNNNSTTANNNNNNNNYSNYSESDPVSHKAANGSVTWGADSLAMSAAVFHQREFKRHRSLASMHRPSLDNIRESEEESKFPTHHKHSNIDLAEAFRILDERVHHPHHHPRHTDPHPHLYGGGDQAGVAEEEEEEDPDREHDGPVAVFHLGNHESSDPDLDHHAED
ncbi:hypothetical protein ACOMHN_007868 [Nucella lapillus]